jgi:hypothetical protein
MMDFCSTHVYSTKKVDNRANLAGGVTISHRTHHNLLCTDKNKHYVPSYMMVYKAMSHMMLPRMQELSHAPTLVA